MAYLPHYDWCCKFFHLIIIAKYHSCTVHQTYMYYARISVFRCHACLINSDQVYFVHPSTDILVDISTDVFADILTDTRPICLSTYLGRHIGRVSVDMSTDISVECWPIYRPIHWSRGAQSTLDP